MTSTHAEPAQRPPADASITPTSGSTRLVGRVVLGLAALYALVVGVLALLRYESFASDFDHGIFSQYVWLLGHLHEPFNTIVLRTLLGDHVEPGIALLAPLGTLGVGAPGILVVQTLALAATAPLLYLLARESGARGWVAAVPALLWCASPVVLRPALHDFHPETLVPVLLVGGLVLLARGHLLWFLLTVVRRVLDEGGRGADVRRARARPRLGGPTPARPRPRSGCRGVVGDRGLRGAARVRERRVRGVRAAFRRRPGRLVRRRRALQRPPSVQRRRPRADADRRRRPRDARADDRRPLPARAAEAAGRRAGRRAQPALRLRPPAHDPVPLLDRGDGRRRRRRRRRRRARRAAHGADVARLGRRRGRRPARPLAPVDERDHAPDPLRVAAPRRPPGRPRRDPVRRERVRPDARALAPRRAPAPVRRARADDRGSRRDGVDRRRPRARDTRPRVRRVRSRHALLGLADRRAGQRRRSSAAGSARSCGAGRRCSIARSPGPDAHGDRPDRRPLRLRARPGQERPAAGRAPAPRVRDRDGPAVRGVRSDRRLDGQREDRAGRPVVRRGCAASSDRRSTRRRPRPTSSGSPGRSPGSTSATTCSRSSARPTRSAGRTRSAAGSSSCSPRRRPTRSAPSSASSSIPGRCG